MDYPVGWTCERTAREFQAYLLSRLALLEALAVAEHLEACQGCAHSIVIYRATLRPAPR